MSEEEKELKEKEEREKGKKERREKREREIKRRKNKAIVIKIIWSFLSVTVIFFLSFFLGQKLKVNWLIFASGFALLVISQSFTILLGTEKGVKEILGIPYAGISSGIHFIFFPIEYITPYPTQEQRLPIPEQKVTAATTSDNKSVELNIDATLYFYWPDDDDLVIVYQMVPMPFNLDQLKNFFSHAIINGIRMAASKTKTWQECMQDRFRDTVIELLENDPIDDAAKIFKFRLALTKVDPPLALKNALAQVHVARSQKEAAITEAEGQRKAIALKGMGEAEARTAIFNAIRQNPENVQLEAFKTLREMAKEPSKMFFQIPDMLTNVFGGKREISLNDIGGKEGLEKLMEEVLKKILAREKFR